MAKVGYDSDKSASKGSSPSRSTNSTSASSPKKEADGRFGGAAKSASEGKNGNMLGVRGNPKNC